MTTKPLTHRPPDTLEDRLVRIETRIVKIMEALNLDPRTGESRRKRPPAIQSSTRRSAHER